MGGAISSLGGGLGVAGGLLGGAIGGVPGMIMGQQYGKGMNSAQPASVNGVDPRIAALRDAQLKQATDYNANKGNLKSDMANSSADASRLKTQQDQTAVRANSSARGLLYGSYNQGRENSVAGGNASDLNKTIANNNLNIENQGQALNQQAISNGLISQGYDQSYNNAVYNSALQNQQAKAGALNGAITGAGQIFTGLL